MHPRNTRLDNKHTPKTRLCCTSSKGTTHIMHKFVISGGLGLLGQRVVRQIISTGRRVRVMVVDAAPPGKGLERDIPTADDGGVGDGGVDEEVRSLSGGGCTRPLNADGLPVLSLVTGDLASTEVMAAIKEFAMGDGCGEDKEVPATPTSASMSSLSVFHLASVMSGQGEQDFSEALRVNVDGTRLLLDTCHRVGGRPRFVFASSIAAFGGGELVNDETKLLPQTTYGMTKACAELLVNDCTRKGYVDGRIARLPTVIVRPGPPNPAATGCFSAVPKAILNGEDFVSPVSSDFRHPCIGLSSAVRGLIRLHDAPEVGMGRRDRAITLPSVSVTLSDLERSAGQLARELGRSPGTVSYEPSDAIESVVKAMPSAVQVSSRATDLGLVADAGAHEMVAEFVKDQGLG